MNTTTSSGQQYAPLTIRLHWLMFALFIGVFASIEMRVLFAKGTEIREAFKTVHFMLGLLVLALGLLRVVVRLRYRAPPIVPALGVWQRRAALLMHGLLYAWLLCMPVAGWLLLSAEGKPIPFFGLELLPLIGKDKATASLIKHWHETAGQAGYWLIGAHAIVALLHHFVKHDNTLVRMLPRLARARS
jgi:superoxide oxidase